MTFYDAIYGKRTPVNTMDKSVSSSETGTRVYVVTCKDCDGRLLKLLQTVRKAGNCGHSFDIVVDPDAKDKETIFWDGDGPDRIDSITSQSAELDLRKVLLANINTIRCICQGAIPSDEMIGKPDDPIEALKKIRTTCDALLDGNGIDFGHGIKEALETLMKNTKQYIKDSETFPSKEKWCPKDGFEHILWCLKHYYEQMVESQNVDKLIKGSHSGQTSDGVTMDKAERGW